MVPLTRMMIGVLTVARAQSAALICAPVLAVTTLPPAPPVAGLPNPTGLPLGGGGGDELTVMLKTWLDCVPQLLVNLAVAAHDAVGVTVCVREVPAVPQPLHDQLPPVDGVGANTTCAPELMVALDAWLPLMNG